MRILNSVSAAALLAVLASSCVSTSVQTFGSPKEATVAMTRAAEEGDFDEARRIFDSFARSSVQRDKVYASLFHAAEDRYESGRGGAAANILGFVTAQYPAAIAAREALVYSLFVERASQPDPVGSVPAALTDELDGAIRGVREASSSPPAWVDLAATQVAIDRGQVDLAREEFSLFLGAWDGSPAALGSYVEDIDRYLQSH